MFGVEPLVLVLDPGEVISELDVLFAAGCKDRLEFFKFPLTRLNLLAFAVQLFSVLEGAGAEHGGYGV